MSPIYHFDPTNPYVGFWVLIGLTLLFTAFILEKKLKGPSKKFLKKAEDSKGMLLRIFQVLVGLSLLFASYRGAILAPHYQGASTSGFFQLLEYITGALLIINFQTRIAATLLLIIYIGTIINFGFFEALDYINLIGIAIFIFLSNKKEVALPILRIFTGLALLILAFSEKFLYPAKAYELVDKYHLNFMSVLGLDWFNHELFIFSAGVVEAVFGLIMIFGWITRVNTTALLSFFVASNIYFFAIGYPEEAFIELTGHLPLIGTAIILLTYGSGNLFKKKNAKT